MRFTQSGDVILLIEDGVIAAIRNTEPALLLETKLNHLSVYALKPDVKARGLLEQVSSTIQLIDYSEFVELTVLHTPIQTWI